MGVKLVSASAGSVEIVPPTTASNYTATLPAGTGTMVVNGINGSIVSGTSVASTSGTFIDFTSIPSWVKRITVIYNGVSTNGTSGLILQIGSGSVDATSYVSNAAYTGSGTGASSATTGYVIVPSAAGLGTNVYTGTNILTLVSSNTWVQSNTASLVQGASLYGIIGGGTKTLSGTLDRVRITTIGGTDTFDAGSINILYE